jgi:hypothetical protein
MRFEHLIGSDPLAIVSLKSLSDIEERINKGWSDIEEEKLSKDNSAYAENLKEIAACRAALDGPALDGPLLAVQHDLEYIAAREALRKNIVKLRKLLLE